MHKHRLEALARNIKSHTRLRDGINASQPKRFEIMLQEPCITFCNTRLVFLLIIKLRLYRFPNYPGPLCLVFRPRRLHPKKQRFS
ncbi:TPA: hypothetical protein JA346_06710 [Legionella pneumophila]|uniref:Uncharacterized protein n=1 Tax=Legionella pneumophila TaxID=446 RepID=A0A2S6EV31_LEGPN|nr:hypothetical protein C3928_13785 [Legionella pneumophila]TIH02723.1 hypothetical protein DI135_06600 [Legionella pneumophila]HAT6362074.1 hypothetical protein [Legionella pneumophila]HAT6364953.1 hypothetical protein [Legionella pneumophila]HAT6369036.1 hypothetical protein [Legionella pneumophila]